MIKTQQVFRKCRLYEEKQNKGRVAKKISDWRWTDDFLTLIGEQNSVLVSPEQDAVAHLQKDTVYLMRLPTPA